MEKLNLSALNLPTKAIPSVIDRKSSRDYVNWGKDNKLPQYLFDTYLGCSELQSLVNTISDYILGAGIESNYSLESDNGDTLEEVIQKCILDYVLFGGFSVECIRNKVEQVVRVNYVNVMNIRVNEALTTAYISNEWNTWSAKDLVTLPLFNKKKQQAHFILYYRGALTRNINPIPIWFSGLKSAETLIETRNFNLNNITNNFSANGMLALNGVELSQEELKRVTEEVESNYSGSDNAGRIIVVNNPNQEGKVEFTRLQPDNTADLYAALQENATNDLYVSFRINKMLVGQNVQTGFSQMEFENAYKLFDATVIKPLQNNIRKVFAQIGIEIEFKPFKIDWSDGTIQ